MRLRVVTPTRVVVDAETMEVTAPGTEGEFGVLPLHTTFVASLRPGVLSYQDGSQEKQLAVDGGFAEVRDDVVSVLASDAVLPEEVDEKAVQAELDDVRDELAEGPESETETALLLENAERMEARLALVE